MTICTSCAREWDAEQLGTECPSCGLEIPGSEIELEESDPPDFTSGIESSGWGAQPSIGQGWSSDLVFDPPGELAEPSPSLAPPPIRSSTPTSSPSSTSVDRDASQFAPASHDPFGSDQHLDVKSFPMPIGKKIVIGVFFFSFFSFLIAFVTLALGDETNFEEQPFDESNLASEFNVDEVGLVDLPIGACFDVASLPAAVSCSEPHEYEIFDSIELKWHDEYPEWEVAWTKTTCVEKFEQFVKIEYQESKLWYEVARTTESAWDSGDHEIRCLVYLPNELLTGTVRDAAY
jgi:hypothetical protein